MLYQMSRFQKLGNVRVLILVPMILAVSCFRAHPPNKAIMLDAGTAEMMRSPDVAFAVNAAQVLAGANQLAELALKQVSDASVKKFAQRIIIENRKISGDLNAAAAKMLLSLPGNATGQQIPQRAGLLGRSGLKVDHAFLNGVVTDSGEAVSSYEKEARKGKDPAMKSFAADALPLLKSRHEDAKALLAKLKATASATHG